MQQPVIYTASVSSTITFTPAMPFSKRIAGITSREIYVASGNELYQIRATQTGADGIPSVKGEIALSSPVVEKLPSFAHSSEITHISAEQSADGRTRLASIDAFGRIRCGILDITHLMDIKRRKADDSSLVVDSRENSVHRLACSSSLGAESGWHGIALKAGNDHLLAAVSHTSSTVSLFDDNQQTRTLFNQARPSAMQWHNDASSNVLFVCEGTAIAMYDTRVDEACVGRFAPSGKALHAVDVAGHVVVTGGIDRSVNVVDTRKWSVLSRWSGWTKHPVTSITLCPTNPSLAYVTDNDNDLVVGRFEQGKEPARFRSYGRWLGIHPVQGNQVLGLSNAGLIYIMDIPSS